MSLEVLASTLAGFTGGFLSAGSTREQRQSDPQTHTLRRFAFSALVATGFSAFNAVFGENTLDLVSSTVFLYSGYLVGERVTDFVKTKHDQFMRKSFEAHLAAFYEASKQYDGGAIMKSGQRCGHIFAYLEAQGEMETLEAYKSEMSEVLDRIRMYQGIKSTLAADIAGKAAALSLSPYKEYSASHKATVVIPTDDVVQLLRMELSLEEVPDAWNEGSLSITTEHTNKIPLPDDIVDFVVDLAHAAKPGRDCVMYSPNTGAEYQDRLDAAETEFKRVYIQDLRRININASQN